jgi:hypothetical protein
MDSSYERTEILRQNVSDIVERLDLCRLKANFGLSTTRGPTAQIKLRTIYE